MIAILLALLIPNAFAEEVTLKDLLKGSKVPLRREFPLSTTVKPCEDFHKYACERVEKSFKMPKDRSFWIFAFSDSAERMLEVRKAYFKRLVSGLEPKLERTKNVKRIYQACMNVESRKQEELALVKEEVEAILGAKERPALLKIFNERLLTPKGLILGLGEASSQDNPIRNDLLMTVGGLSLPERSYYHDPAAVQDLKKVAISFFKEIKADKVEERAQAVVDFESALAEVLPLPAESRELWSSNTYEKRSDLISVHPNLALKSVFDQLPTSTKIRNFNKKGLAFFNEYLGKSAPLNLQSVMIFQSLRGYMDDAYPGFFKVNYDFLRKHHGAPPVRSSREERCVGAAMSLGMEMDAELLAALFSDFDGDKVREASESVRQALVEGIQKNTWLTESARKEALNKAKLAVLQLVKPKTEKDWNFTDLPDLSDSKPLQNMIVQGKVGIAKMLKRIREDRNRDEWFTGPLTVNAFYSSDDNSFYLPQGILQYPFFDAAQSREENLGSMGMIVGHELGHGIDDEGAKYDSKGVLRDWMTPLDHKAFEERGAKLVAQFDKVGHNGKLTLGENIGDNVGLDFALKAAFPKPDEAKLEDVRKFFVSYGRLWCNVVRPERRKVMVKTNPHAMPEERINQQVVHRDLFYKAYACKKGDKMYLPPEDRVQVW